MLFLLQLEANAQNENHILKPSQSSRVKAPQNQEHYYQEYFHDTQVAQFGTNILISHK